MMFKIYDKLYNNFTSGDEYYAQYSISEIIVSPTIVEL